MNNKLITILIALFLLAFNRGYANKEVTYHIQSAIAGKYLDVKGGGTSNGTPLQIWPLNRTPAQIFILEDSGDGYFYIKVLGKYIHIQGRSKKPKALAHVWDGKGNDNTKWKLKDAGNGYFFIQSKVGTYLDVQGGNSASGTPIWMWGFNGGNAQKWKLKKVSSSISKKMTSFKPEIHGFAFSNTFQNHGFVAGGNINFSGLCGGMSYTCLDYFHGKIQIPSNTKKPNEGTKLTEFIRNRQWKTYENQADKWAEIFINPFGWRTSEFWTWGIQGFGGGSLEKLTKEINKGRPVVLGLFAAGSGGITSKHHQVIAIGYDLGRYKGDLKQYKDDMKIFICDPNRPGKTMTLRPDSKNHRYYYEESPTSQWLTYFVDLNYRSVKPLDPKVLTKCSEVNFTNKDFSGQTHNQKNYRCAQAPGVKFRGSTVSGTDFYRSNLVKSYFLGANCRNSNFEMSILKSSNFEGADLKNCNFSSTDLSRSRFYGADLKYAIFNRANALGCNFQGADLHKGKFVRVSFKEAYLFNTSLNTADCSYADFTGANLDGADLRGANLYKANFRNSIITRNTKFDTNSISKVRNWPGIQ